MSKDPYEWLAFLIEIACTATGFYFSSIAGAAVLVAIVTQCAWSYRKMKKERP